MKGLIFTFLLLTFSAGLFATAQKKQLQLRLQAQNSNSDKATIYFDLGVGPLFNSAEDGPKVLSSIPGVPNIYSLSSDNAKCAINGYSPLTQGAVIGLGVLLDSSALYTFSLTQLYNFDSTTLVILEDRRLHVFTEMQTGFYQVQLTSADTTGRFFLHVTRSVQLTQVTAGCSNNNGAISILTDSAILWSTISLLDSNAVTITSNSNIIDPMTFNNLAEGSYFVAFAYGNYSTVKPIQVKGNSISANFTASSQNIVVGESVSFVSTVTNTSGYAWYFGDSAVITGVANPSYFYYTPGVYTVTMMCTNVYGCTAEVQMTITVGDATGLISQPVKAISVTNLSAKTIEILMNGNPLNNTELQVYNILGQMVYSSPVTANKTEVSLTNEPNGIYLLSIKNEGKTTTTKVYIN